MSQNVKMVKMPVDLHERAVALDERVVERFGPPPNYRRGGPGAAIHAGVALLEAVLNGEQHIVPAAHMQEYEAAYRGREKAALLSILTLCFAMRLAHAEGAEDVDARASDLVVEGIRELVRSEILEAEAEAEPQTAEALRQIAREFLDDAERLSARARAAIASEAVQ